MGRIAPNIDEQLTTLTNRGMAMIYLRLTTNSKIVAKILKKFLHTYEISTNYRKTYP